MAPEAELVDDPVFLQRYRFTREGDVLRIDVYVDPGGGVTVEHLHPRMEERFQVLEGEITFRVAGVQRRAGPGDRLLVEPGVPHSFRNSGPGAARLVSVAEPALELQESIEEAAALACAGKITRRGLPTGLGSLLELARFAERYRDTLQVTSPALALQRVLVAPLARLGRWRASRLT
jgi:mannose-6-phosphate isomerase-like protein (cupin superfamily)